VFLWICISSLSLACSPSKDGKPEEKVPDVYPEAVENYNYIIGTQTIGASYQFTEENRLVETAKQILLMGSNILKISLGEGYEYSYEMFEKDAAMKELLSMDFKYYFFWVYTPKVDWANGLSAQESQIEYENLYKLAEYLLKNCAGKEFYLGHWEGDWHLTDMNGNMQTVNPVKIQGMIDWYNIRQKAIEDAKAANTGSDVKIYHYCEVNRVYDALKYGFDRIVNKVLPHTNVDFVSYSSYDAIGSSKYESLEKDMHSALNYIEENMKSKPGITGRRVFIGEYAFSGRNLGAQAQDSRTRMVMKAALKWGCPFILYWEMYNNEIEDQGGHVGYWLINDKGIKQSVYYTHSDFYKAMKKQVYTYNAQNGHLPSQAEYLENAVKYFDAVK
jgi:hypothetical protein